MTDTGSAPYPDAVVAAIAQAYYARATASPDTARSRAQAAFGIASAVAGGLVAAAVISKFPSAHDAVQILGVFAVAFWLTATSLYLLAVAVPVQLPESASEVVGGSEFAKTVIRRALAERETVDKRQKWANGLSAVAMSVTLVTFALGIFLPGQSFYARMSVSPTPGPTSTNCLGQPHVITGNVVTTSLQSTFVQIDGASVCGEAVQTLYVDRQQIVEIRATVG